MSTPDPNEMLCVGAIAGAFGVKGETRLKSFCADPEAIADYAPLTDETGKKTFTVKILRPVKGGFAAMLGGISTREQAEKLRGLRLFAPRHRMPDLLDDEFYHSDLIGIDVYDTGGEKLGEVTTVADYGGGDFIEVKLLEKGKLLLVPFTQENVPTVDLTAGRLVIDPPEDAAEPEE